MNYFNIRTEKNVSIVQKTVAITKRKNSLLTKKAMDVWDKKNYSQNVYLIFIAHFETSRNMFG